MNRAYVLGRACLVAALTLTACGDDDVADETAPTTSISPEGGTYRPLPQTVTLTADEPATVYYTVDGSEPDADSPHAASPVTLSLSGDTRVRFFSIDDAGLEEEERGDASFTLDEVRPAALADFAAAPDGADVDLSWAAPTDDDATGVLIARIGGAYPIPEDGATYAAGDELPGGGEVIFVGDGTEHTDADLVPGFARYAGWTVDAVGNYSPIATADAITEIEQQLASISVDVDTAVVTVSSAPALHDIEGTAIYDGGTDTLTVDVTFTNNASRAMYAPKLIVTNEAAGTFSNSDGDNTNGDPYKRSPEVTAIDAGEDGTVQLVFTGVLDATDVTFDVEIPHDRLIVGYPVENWGSTGGVEYVDTGTLEQFLSAPEPGAIHGPNGSYGGRAGAVSRDGRLAYVGSRNAESIAVLDLVANEYVEFIPLPIYGYSKGHVRSVILDSTGTKLYVLVGDGMHAYSWGTQFGAKAHLLVYDLTTRAVTGHVAVEPEGFEPEDGEIGLRDLAISADESRAAFAFYDHTAEIGLVYVVDLATMAVLDADDATDGTQPLDLSATLCANRVALSADGGTLFVASRGGDGSGTCWVADPGPNLLAEVDLEDWSSTTTDAGADIHSLTWDDEGTLWVGTSNALQPYDPSDDSLGASESGEFVSSVLFEDGFAAVSNYGDFTVVELGVGEVASGGGGTSSWYGNKFLATPY